VGRAQNDARSVLERASWRVSIRTVDNAAERGTVVGQSPRGTALPGETIVLSVSSGSVPPPPAAPTAGAPPQPNGQPPARDQPPSNGGDNGNNGGNGG
jgi:beta-lactam-binding protein with PASTA domain